MVGNGRCGLPLAPCYLISIMRITTDMITNNMHNMRMLTMRMTCMASIPARINLSNMSNLNMGSLIAR